MALWLCVQCTALYAVGLDHCPQCGSMESIEEGEEMAPEEMSVDEVIAAVEANESGSAEESVEETAGSVDGPAEDLSTDDESDDE